jgi:hypothetical protein
LQQADEVLEQNTLAAAAAPDDGDRFAAFNPKADAIEDFLRAETFVQLADFNHNCPTSFPVTSVRKKFAIRMLMEA